MKTLHCTERIKTFVTTPSLSPHPTYRASQHRSSITVHHPPSISSTIVHLIHPSATHQHPSGVT
ncbi:hypothetical protein E2C01_020085 [Portunus trituberculatus]|uniref:Uncharacterized protein n=1 Tax=Portunus trituberculatus TaxID=210409 RepID=A0A5B7E152_PORTR|nr:hypothetical protein [Portunus trituberculatus]